MTLRIFDALGLFAIVLSMTLMCSAPSRASKQDATLADFNRRISEYVELRDTIDDGIPSLANSAKSVEIATGERQLAERVRSARATATHGDIFTPAIQATFKRLLGSELQGVRGKTTRGIIMDANPGPLAFAVNGTYPKDEPLSTVPPNILRRLPPLPPDLEYRFIGRHLILREARANLIVDYIRNAIP